MKSKLRTEVDAEYICEIQIKPVDFVYLELRILEAERNAIGMLVTLPALHIGTHHCIFSKLSSQTLGL
jgi:hypothetical protein